MALMLLQQKQFHFWHSLLPQSKELYYINLLAEGQAAVVTISTAMGIELWDNSTEVWMLKSQV